MQRRSHIPSKLLPVNSLITLSSDPIPLFSPVYFYGTRYQSLFPSLEHPSCLWAVEMAVVSSLDIRGCG
ncbi:Hypp2587 [Branchiostoma lanceolatum]|uniref:Hypp2587 protein n=1 Tax=Branchiostoma lanceolatum TaxID=7740 RepID=A0A8K0ETJ0_BRALA|nr:Hypp2587 [Branchiostoma lanceolatum]